MDWTRASIIALSLLLTTAGCRTAAMPSFCCPGPANQQQLRAQRFDPYTESELGPEVLGGRPREYDRAIPEVDRARWTSMPCYQGNQWSPQNWGQTQ